MSNYIKTEAPVVCFCMHGSNIYMLCEKELIRANAETGSVVSRKTVFEKDGKSRLIRTNGEYLAVSDFCTLSLFHAGTFESIREAKLGTDLTNDICGLFMDNDYIFVSIRNGELIRISINDFSQSSVSMGDASCWSLAEHNGEIYAGTVDGKLIRLDRETMKTESVLSLSRQNVKSLYIDGCTLYAAGQDKKLYVIDLTSFELVRRSCNMHKKMFDIIGVHNGILYTVSHPGSEICGWNNKGEKVCNCNYKLRLSGSSNIYGTSIFLSSRNICGIEKIDTNKIQNISLQ